MSTAETEPAGIDPQVLAGLDAVMKRISDGAAVDPETSRRIEERADRITAEIRRTRGVMDDDRFQALLDMPSRRRASRPRHRLLGGRKPKFRRRLPAGGKPARHVRRPGSDGRIVRAVGNDDDRIGIIEGRPTIALRITCTHCHAPV